MTTAPIGRSPAVGPLIIKIGGSTLDDRASTAALWPALVKLHGERPGGVVLVHGGGKAVDRHIAGLGLPTERREGLRLTPDDQIDAIVGVLAGSVNKSLVGAINAAGGRAVGLCLGDGALARSRKRTDLSFDPGRVGEVRGGDGELVRVLLDRGFLPVLCSIGLDDQGAPLNLNADDAAAGLVSVVRASGLVLLTDVPGVMDAGGRVLPALTPGECESLIASGEVKGGMIPKVRAASRIAEHARIDVVIMSGDPRQLLAWIQGEPAGTRFTAAAPGPDAAMGSPAAPAASHR